jgi:hypothetical protein
MNIINRLWPVSMSGSGRRRFEYFFRLREGQRNLLPPPRIINHPSTSSSTGQVGNCCFAIRTSHFKSFGKKRRLKSLSYRNSPDFCQRTRNFILFAYRKIPDKFQILDVPSCEKRLDRQSTITSTTGRREMTTPTNCKSAQVPPHDRWWLA